MIRNIYHDEKEQLFNIEIRYLKTKIKLGKNNDIKT